LLRRREAARFLTMAPIVVLPVSVDDGALDACLAAIDAGTQAGTRVWLADDARAGPREHAIIQAWLARTPMEAHYTRRQRMVGDVAHLDCQSEAGEPIGEISSRFNLPARRILGIGCNQPRERVDESDRIRRHLHRQFPSAGGPWIGLL